MSPMALTSTIRGLPSGTGSSVASTVRGFSSRRQPTETRSGQPRQASWWVWSIGIVSLPLRLGEGRIVARRRCPIVSISKPSGNHYRERDIHGASAPSEFLGLAASQVKHDSLAGLSRVAFLKHAPAHLTGPRDLLKPFPNSPEFPHGFLRIATQGDRVSKKERTGAPRIFRSTILALLQQRFSSPERWPRPG